MPQDLFQSTSNQSVTSSTPVYTNNYNLSTINSQVANSLTSFSLNDVVYQMNVFAIVWTIMLSFLFVSDFFFYYKLESDSNFEREMQGVKSLKKALSPWFRYIPFWIVITLSAIFPSVSIVLNIVAILFWVIKIWGDLLSITTISEYFKGFTKFLKTFNQLLRLSKSKARK